EHDLVDAVVPAVQHDGTNLRCRLAEPVYPALALFVPGGVPGQVVVHHGLEVGLQVDAFGKAVGGDQHRAQLALVGAPGEVVDALAPLLRRQCTGDHLDGGDPPQRTAEPRPDVLRGVDVAAEH